MKIFRYLIIFLTTIITAGVGSYITDKGMRWYKTIQLPTWTPTGGFIGLVWTIIFLLAAISAVIVFSKKTERGSLEPVALAFFINAILNVGWSYVFFGSRLIGWAIVEAVLLEISVIILILIVRPFSKVASQLLWPYAIWVAFATYLTYNIWLLNS